MRFPKTKASTRPGYFAPFVYLCFITLIAFSSARQAISNYYVERAVFSGSDALAQNAILYQPDNPYAHNSLGTILLRNKDFRGAAQSFEKAVSLRENDFLLWLSLGVCRERMGQFEAAENAYQNAVLLAPSYSEPKLNLGILHYDNGRYDAAFRILSEAAANDIDLYPKLLDLARVAFRDEPNAIENAVRPTSYEAKKIFANYMIGHDLMTDNLRSFLLSPDLKKKDKDELIRFLINKNNFQTAREVWLTSIAGVVTDSNRLIFDGGFENIRESDEFGFGWKIDQTASALAVSINENEFHSGSRSVWLKFAGDVDLNRKLISQIVHVMPRRKYRLTFYYRSPEMISAGLPAVVVSDAVSNKTLARSTAIQTTQVEWKESAIDFTSAETPAVIISLQRPSCNTVPCPLFGELILDDFSLAEVRN